MNTYCFAGYLLTFAMHEYLTLGIGYSIVLNSWTHGDWRILIRLGGGDSLDPHYLQSLHKTDDDKTYLHFGKQSTWKLIQNIRCRDKERSFFLNHV